MNLRLNLRIQDKPHVKKDVTIDTNKEMVSQGFRNYSYLFFPVDVYMFVEDILGSINAELGNIEGIFLHYKDSEVIRVSVHNFKSILFEFQSFFSSVKPIMIGGENAYALNFVDFNQKLQKLQVGANYFLGILDSFDNYLLDTEKTLEKENLDYVTIGSDKAIA